jgi:hypothetical protein
MQIFKEHIAAYAKVLRTTREQYLHTPLLMTTEAPACFDVITTDHSHQALIAAMEG